MTPTTFAHSGGYLFCPLIHHWAHYRCHEDDLVDTGQSSLHSKLTSSVGFAQCQQATQSTPAAGRAAYEDNLPTSKSSIGGDGEDVLDSGFRKREGGAQWGQTPMGEEDGQAVFPGDSHGHLPLQRVSLQRQNLDISLS
jgi:hypothetical protein